MTKFMRELYGNTLGGRHHTVDQIPFDAVTQVRHVNVSFYQLVSLFPDRFMGNFELPVRCILPHSLTFFFLYLFTYSLTGSLTHSHFAHSFQCLSQALTQVFPVRCSLAHCKIIKGAQGFLDRAQSGIAPGAHYFNRRANNELTNHSASTTLPFLSFFTFCSSGLSVLSFLYSLSFVSVSVHV